MRVVVGIITDNKEILLLKRIIQTGKKGYTMELVEKLN